MAGQMKEMKEENMALRKELDQIKENEGKYHTLPIVKIANHQFKQN